MEMSCSALANLVTDKDQVEKYLASGGVAECIPVALIQRLNVDAAGLLEPMKEISPRWLIAYLETLWPSDDDIGVGDKLRSAAERDLIYLIPYLITSEMKETDPYDDRGEAMVGAVDNGNIDAAELLINLGADINFEDNAALESAATSGNPAMLEMLIRHGIMEKAVPEEVHYKDITALWPRWKSLRPMTYMPTMCKRKFAGVLARTPTYLPVVRYQSIYHDEKKKNQYCGTFYFIEPESPVLLDLGRTAVFGSKVHALLSMIATGKILSEWRMDERGIVPDVWYGSHSYVNGKLADAEVQRHPGERIYRIYQLISMIWREIYDKFNLHKFDDFIAQDTLEKIALNPQMEEYFNNFFRTYMMPYYFAVLKNEADVKVIPGIETTPLYPTDTSPYWNKENKEIGEHDYLDAFICQYGRALGIDTIILQHEIGEYRSVTEILDTRANSYEHLVRVHDKKGSWWKISERYPTIWFLNDGLIDVTGCPVKFMIDESDMNRVKQL